MKGKRFALNLIASNYVQDNLIFINNIMTMINIQYTINCS